MKNVKYYEFDDFRLDTRRYRLQKGGASIPFTNKTFGLLHVLLKNARNVVDKVTIISEIWGNVAVEQSNLSQQIYILRKLLGNDAEGKTYIETITKRGFRFTKRVVEITAAIKLDCTNPNDGGNIAPLLKVTDESKSLPEISPGETKQGGKLLNKPNKFFQYLPDLHPAGKSGGGNRINLSLLLVILAILGLILVAGYIYDK